MRWEVPLLPEALVVRMIIGAVVWMLIVFFCEFLLGLSEILDSKDDE